MADKRNRSKIDRPRNPAGEQSVPTARSIEHLSINCRPKPSPSPPAGSAAVQPTVAAAVQPTVAAAVEPTVTAQSSAAADTAAGSCAAAQASASRDTDRRQRP